MSFIIWNCQGAGSKEFVRAARMFIKSHNPSIMGLLETKISGETANTVCKKLNFSNWTRIEAIGYSGGIWILWKDEIYVMVSYIHPQFAVLDVCYKGKRWNLVVVYASPDYQLRNKLWFDLNKERLGLWDEWIAVGDFNAVTNADEVSNQNTFNQRRCAGLKNWIHREGLIDLGFTGPLFTWVRGKETDNFKGARLDRVVCSMDWLNSFPDANVKHLTRIKSDHSPVLVHIVGNASKRKKGFMFQAAWMSHPYFKNFIADNWNKEEKADTNTKRLAPLLENWNKECFGNIFSRKNRLMARLNGVQKALARSKNNGLLHLERKLRQELEGTLYQEEVYWYQRSREDWICSGDKNTKFYHATANIKKVRKRTEQLMSDDGEWIEDENMIKNLIRDHFKSIFTQEVSQDTTDVSRDNYPKINQDLWDRANAEFSSEDIKRAMFDMAPFKAPGPDGFHAGFYQKEWNTVGQSVIEQARSFFRTGDMPEGLNDTLISLVPKVNIPEKASQFRPISLCNVGYKVITKAMANRIKEIMRKLVGQEQSSFVPDRQIVDNIIVYQEVMHSMRKKDGNKKMMALKIDLEKAYDRLSWDFIRDTLKEAGFNDDWIRNIMACITTTRLGILWNGEQLDWIVPSRGIRQGDALSPYIFVLCIERLCHKIREAVNQGRWKGVKLSRYGPTLSHLFLLMTWFFLQKQVRNKLQ